MSTNKSEIISENMPENISGNMRGNMSENMPDAAAGDPADAQYGKSVGYAFSDQYIAVEDIPHLPGYSSVTPINLDYYGSEQCKSGYKFGPFVRTSYVLHMVVRGCGCLYKEQGTYEIRAGQAFLICPEEVTTYQADRDDPWKYMWIGFHGYRAEQMMAQAGLSITHPVITIANIREVEKTMNELLQARELTYLNELQRMSSLYRLLFLLTQGQQAQLRSPAGTESDAKTYVDAAVTMLMDASREQIRIADVAKAIGISRSYLTHVFRDTLGISPQEFLTEYRMEKAASLLGSTKSPVNVIALEVGYPDSLAFSKAFRKRFGLSPTEYRTYKPALRMHHKKEEAFGSHPLQSP